jgi:hypothetical protein
MPYYGQMRGAPAKKDVVNETRNAMGEAPVNRGSRLFGFYTLFRKECCGSGR